MSPVGLKRMRCIHLRVGTIAKHATMRVETVPPEENTTDYAWDIAIELCVLCSGFVRGKVSGAPVFAEEDGPDEEKAT